MQIICFNGDFSYYSSTWDSEMYYFLSYIFHPFVFRCCPVCFYNLYDLIQYLQFYVIAQTIKTNTCFYIRDGINLYHPLCFIIARLLMINFIQINIHVPAVYFDADTCSQRQVKIKGNANKQFNIFLD
ncbi:unnamed protein product (macronuclear) [Paramecium tetraurelia]|uniref:Uncharacterized protein n=1 Tax=Paramecium tetraurelia TaxID=5888 RepID=A0CUT7_PARTE|nr:uncharacterized protein GSPATT00039006001 [Paramecium tetraurelia]CAK74554.1 unnamed protein product [Paramecium tetraurelia]|eukprot:XP_001441951.1 hypothetical protein (macronuclear) [Paramecium tetraurelia strain d4-2]